MFKKKPTASEVDGVQYRRAKTWQIICYACNALVGMSVYSLIGMASYSASIGYGITTAAVGIILTCSRILDGITDPLLAFVYDRVNTKFGKLRVLLVAGYLIEAAALYAMFTGFSSKGLGLPVFALLYVLYIIGYTVSNMTAQTIPAIMTNDPRQRPTLGVWTTAFNYLVPMVMSMVLNVVLLPKCGGTYNQAFLTAACNITLIVAAIGTLLVCLGVSAFDKPESFVGTKKAEPLKMADIVEVLKHNKPLQCYIASNASDKLAQQVGSQAIINTILGGIIIGNIGLGTILTVISMVPSIFFAAFGAKYVGKHGSKKGIVNFTCISMVITAVMVVFFLVIDPKQIGVMGSPAMIIYVILSLLQNGSNMCITTSTPRTWPMPLTLSSTAAGVIFPPLSPAPTAWSINSSPLCRRDCHRRGGAAGLHRHDAPAHGSLHPRYLLDGYGSQVCSAYHRLDHYADCHAQLPADQGGDGQRPEAHCREKGCCAV